MKVAHGNWRWMRRRNRKFLVKRNQTRILYGFSPKRVPKELNERDFLKYDRITWARKRMRYFFAADFSNKTRWEKVMA